MKGLMPQHGVRTTHRGTLPVRFPGQIRGAPETRQTLFNRSCQSDCDIRMVPAMGIRRLLHNAWTLDGAPIVSIVKLTGHCVLDGWDIALTVTSPFTMPSNRRKAKLVEYACSARGKGVRCGYVNWAL